MTTIQEALDRMKEAGVPAAQQQALKDFIGKEIPSVPFFKPDGKPKKEWRIFYGENWDAAWDAVWGAARGAAWDAARDAARGAAWDAAASGAAWDAARGAAWDAALFSDYIITADLKFKDKEKHFKHVKARWEVWQKGYGLICDVDGVLYVFAVKPKDVKPMTDAEARKMLDSLEKRIAALEGKAVANEGKLKRIREILEQ